MKIEEIILIGENLELLEEISNFMRSQDYNVYSLDKNFLNIDFIENTLKSNKSIVIIHDSYLNNDILPKKIDILTNKYNSYFFYLLESLDISDILYLLDNNVKGIFTNPYNYEEILANIEYISSLKKLRKYNSNTLNTTLKIYDKKYVFNEENSGVLGLIINLIQKTLDRNITLKKANHALMQMHNEIEKKNIDLQTLNEQKNQILSIAAHDLREPLSIIWRYSNSFLKNNALILNEEQKESISVIKNYSSHMIDLVSNILEFFDILNLNIDTYNIKELILKNIELNEPIAKEKKIKLLFTCENEIPLVKIDSSKINKVLNNLISTSIKYSQEENIIKIKVKYQNNEVLVSISDADKKIKYEDAERIFKPLVEYSDEEHNREEHNLRVTGFGLAVVKKIINAHGGKVWIDDEIINGSTIYISLPA
jgi:signal transduction histidine kinase